MSNWATTAGVRRAGGGKRVSTEKLSKAAWPAQPESPRTYRGRGLFVVHVIRDGERYGDARVDQQIRAAYRAPPSRTIA